MPAIRYGVVVFMIVILLGGFGTSTYAYSSSEVTEGTIFYPIKRNIEKIEEKFKKTPEEKVRFYLKQIERREGELKRLQQYKKNEVKTQVHLEIMDKKIIQAQEWIKNKQIQNPQIKSEIEKRIKIRKDFLQKNKEGMDNSKTKPVIKLNNSTKIIKTSNTNPGRMLLNNIN